MAGAPGSRVVDGRPGGVAAAGWCGPVHDAGLGLAELPAGCLLAPVVAAAGGGEVALAGDAGGVGEGVVEVAERGVGAAAGCGAAGGAGADQVFEVAAGGVAVFAAGVVAAAFGDRGEGEIQPAQEFGERDGLPGVGTGSGGAGDRRRDPRMGLFLIAPVVRPGLAHFARVAGLVRGHNHNSIFSEMHRESCLHRHRSGSSSRLGLVVRSRLVVI